MSRYDTFDDEFDSPYRAPDVAGSWAKAGAEKATFLGYGGFLLRFGAMIIDNIILAVAGGMLGLVVGVMIALSGGDPGDLGPQVLLNLTGFALNLIYYATMESSAMQATLGKAALGLKVTDLAGRRISFGRAIGRELGKILSGLLLCIGYLMVIWDSQKQGLHDKMAGTLVIRSR